MSPNLPPTQRLRWRLERIEALGAADWHLIQQARQQVFIVEQNCVFLDADAADLSSWHLAAWTAARQVAAYARIVDPGVKYAEPSLGRVLTGLAWRGRGLGRELVGRAIADAGRLFPKRGLRISAQHHLQGFYAGFGFEPVGAVYLEDGIAHIEMVVRPAG